MKHITAIVSILFFCACTKSTIDPKLVADPEYCPLQKGAWIDYAVTSIRIDVKTDLYDTAQYTLREEVDALIDSAGDDMTYRIVRKVRMSNDLVWQDLDAILIIKTPNSLIRQEQNTPVLSISYPLKIKKAWNGNVLNTLDSAHFYVKSLNVRDTAYAEFDSVLTVVQEDFESLINIESSTEKYAVNLGLIEKSQIHASSDSVYIDGLGLPIPVLNQPDYASIYIQKYIAHGKK